MDHYQQTIDTLFYAIVTGGIGYACTFLAKLSKAISELNKNIAVVIERMADHDYRIQRLEKQVDNSDN